MPATTHPDFAPLGHHGKFGLRGAAGSGLRSMRSDRENGYPATAKSAGQRSPRLGQASSNHSNQFGTDLTNVSGKAGPGKLKPLKHLPLLLKPEVPVATLRLETALPTQGRQQVAVVARTEPENAHDAAEYANDIDDQLFRQEAKLMLAAGADYMDMQTDLTPKMRTILMDWLIEVHMKYRLRSETLHLCVNLIDRILAKMPIARKRLQLIGVCAMFIAAKFEEITPPELHDWVYITDKAYTKEDMLSMECTMLSALNFQIVVPTAAHFFHGLQKANGCNDIHRSLAQYILELSILDIRTLHFAPSHLVAAALLLSNEILGRRPAWPSLMATQSRHTEPALRACVDFLRKLFDSDRTGAGGQLQAVHKKFSSPDHHSVATVMF